MSFNIFLKSEIRDHSSDFKVKRRENGDGEEWDEYSFGEIKLSKEKDRYYLVIHRLYENIPQCIQEFVEEVTYCEWLPDNPKRTAGVYKLNDATAFLNTTRGNRDDCWLEITGKSMESVITLYRKIRAGTITPVESWEREQKKVFFLWRWISSLA